MPHALRMQHVLLLWCMYLEEPILVEWPLQRANPLVVCEVAWLGEVAKSSALCQMLPPWPGLHGPSSHNVGPHQCYTTCIVTK